MSEEVLKVFREAIASLEDRLAAVEDTVDQQEQEIVKLRRRVRQIKSK